MKQHNDDIILLLPDEEIDNDMIASDKTDMDIKRAIKKYRKELDSFKLKIIVQLL